MQVTKLWTHFKNYIVHRDFCRSTLSNREPLFPTTNHPAHTNSIFTASFDKLHVKIELCLISTQVVFTPATDHFNARANQGRNNRAKEATQTKHATFKRDLLSILITTHSRGGNPWCPTHQNRARIWKWTAGQRTHTNSSVTGLS